MNQDYASTISFKLVFDHSSIASMLVMNSEGIILEVNKAMENTYGYSKDELVGKYFGILFTVEDRLKQLPEVEIATVLKQGSMMDINYILNKDGNAIWTNGETTSSKDTQGNVLLVKIIYGIHKEKLLESFLLNANQELHEKNERLENINREQEAFVYMASHDLKGPINNIESLVGIIKESLPEECHEGTEKAFEMVYASVEKFKSVIQDLSMIGKENAEYKTQSNLIYFSEILEDIKLALREEISSTKTIFLEDFQKSTVANIPSRSLRSILYNLISNGIKYRSPHRRAEIKIAIFERNDQVVIRVSDNGIGMKKDDHKEIFKPYQRLPETRHIEGTGVGLSIVEKLVLNSGGSLNVESVYGEGTTFEITLPAY